MELETLKTVTRAWHDTICGCGDNYWRHFVPDHIDLQWPGPVRGTGDGADDGTGEDEGGLDMLLAAAAASAEDAG